LFAAPVTTVPLMLVVPPSHFGICLQSGQSTPQTLGARAPQIWPVGHVPQLSVAPQPLLMSPQYWPFGGLHVYTFLQAPPSVLAPQTLFTPAPPHVQPGSTQFIPQSMPPPH
jgi:hypothetical protein